MAFRKAKSLDTLLEQVNERYPTRSRKSDGWIGDANHASRSSDHNPWVKDGSMGIVTAIDITHDPANGLHARELAEALIASRDPRIKYIISEGQMCRSYRAKDGTAPWTWTKYKGPNGHFHHVHISVASSKDLYDNTRPWDIIPVEPSIKPAEATPKQDLLKAGSKGNEVLFVQRALGIKADGDFGPATKAAVIAFQKRVGLTADGIVGPDTWAKLL